ncbi:MAG TPA: winged helix-turn-helix domain-containing protein [Blastocatellia bacterium]|nr:winged helix-turn-helix domain-containing protein [Blastocatellia bacterium]
MSNKSGCLYQFGPFRLDRDERVLSFEGKPVPLTPKAFDTLFVLVQNNGHVVSKDSLMGQVWPDSFVEETNLAQNISLIRKALSERSDGIQYIETVPKRGYRFIAKVSLESDSSPDLAVQGPDSRPRSTPAAQSRPDTELKLELEPAGPDAGTGSITSTFAVEARDAPAPGVAVKEGHAKSPAEKIKARVLLAGLAALIGISIAVLALVYFFRVKPPVPGTAGRTARTLAVLPFQNLRPDAQTNFLGFSLADAIITKLDYVGSLIVRPSSYIGKYQNREIDPKTVASELNVDTLLTGGYLRDGDELRITTQLIDVNTNRILWRDTIDMKYEKLLTVQDQVAQQIIKGLELNLSPAEAERLRRDVPGDPLAYEYYLRGIDLAQAGKFSVAIDMLEKSVALDPNYGMTWAQLGGAYTARAAFGFGGREDYAKAQAAYQHALKLNPDQLEAHIFLSNFFTDTNRVEQSVPLLREALKTNPNNAMAHWELSYAERFGGMLQESIQEAELARELDPEVKINSSAMNAYLYSGQDERFLKSLPDVEQSAFIVFYRGFARYHLKQYSEAAASFDRAYEMDPSLFAQIGKALSFGIGGQAQKGKDLLQGTERKVEDNGVSDPEALYKIAQAYIALGDKDSGLRMLRRSIEDGFFCYPYFITDPLLEPVRGEPEYKTLMEQARKRHEEFKKTFFGS